MSWEQQRKHQQRWFRPATKDVRSCQIGDQWRSSYRDRMTTKKHKVGLVLSLSLRPWNTLCILSLSLSTITYEETNGEDRSDTGQRSSHTTVETQNPIVLDDLLEAITSSFVDTFGGLKSDLDEIKRLTSNGKCVSSSFLFRFTWLTRPTQQPYHQNLARWER